MDIEYDSYVVMIVVMNILLYFLCDNNS